MKTFFTRLGSLLLCGVVFAMVGCTDFSEDIQAVDQKVDQVASNLSATDVKVENLQQTLNELSARLDADYATKAELNKVSEDLNKVIADQVAGLDAKIGKVGEDLAAAVKNVNAAIATLEAADAANEAAIEAARAEAAAAVATLAAALEAEKAAVAAEIEAINAQIAETNEAIAAVDAKAEENHNTLVALSDYLANLEAKVNELKATLDSLSEYLPTVEAKIASNTAKIDELKNTLESLALHLNAKEAEVDAKLNELHNTLASLSVYMDVLEASIDARFAEILNTIESLSIYLAKLEAQVALNTESSAAANAKAEELYNTILSLSEYLAEEKAANDAKFQEILNTFESLSIHLAKLEAEHAAGIADNSAKIAELKNELVSLSAHLAETEADYAAKFTEIQNTFLSLSEHLNAEEAANAAKFAEILATFESLSQYLDAEEAENDAKFAELQNTLLSLSEYLPTVEAKVDELKNTLESLANHLNEREPLVDAKLSELQSTLLSLSIYLEEANLVNRVSALEGDLKAHKAAFEVFEAATVEQLTNLVARTEELFGQLEALSPEFAAVKSQVAELKNELVALSAHLEEREAGVDAKLNELFATFESLSPVIETMQAQIKENNAALVSLSPVIETMQAQILENFNTLQSLSPEIEKLHAKDAELEAKVAELKGTLDSLSEFLPTLEAQIKEVKGTVESLGAEYEANKDVVDAKLLELHNTLASLSEQLPTMIGAVDAKVNELKGTVDSLSEQLPGIIAAALAPVEANVEALLDRVQSLVYVPDYDDHKATISWAELSGEESYGILVKKSVLRYRVYANADEDAVAAAKAIENTWTPESFYYEVEPVKRAWTRSATVPATLEITDVWAEGEYLNVEVLAKNFNPEFFFSYWYGDNNPRMAIKPEEGKPADEKSSYSVSLVLSDGNNNRSTEYTNLVPAYPEYIQAVVLDGNEKDITFMECPETEPVNLLPYDLDPKEVVVLKDHALSFVWEGKNYSAAELIAAGYDIQLERRQHYTYPGNGMDYRVDGKSQVIELGVGDVKFEIHERDFVSEVEEGNTYVTLTRALTKEEYLSLEEKNLDITFLYNVNGVEVYTTSTVEICNRLVVVDLGDVEIPWTMELAYNLHDGTKAYALPVKYTGYEYDLAKCANKPLEGYNLHSILQTGSPKKTHGGDYDIQMSISDKTLDFTLSGKYAFANVYDQDGWNDHTVQWVNEFDDLTITVKANVKLGQIPGTLNVADSDLEFKLVPGVNGWVYANSNIVEKMFAKYRDLVGFADDDEAAMAFFSERLAASRVMARELNGEINTLLDPQNVDTPIHSFDPLKLGIHQSQIADAEKQTMFVHQWDKITGANFAFDFDGTVVLPEYGLEYSTVDFVSYDANQERWEVEVDGDIVADSSVEHGRKYTIDQADLGKYFYVNDNVEYGVETALTVKFEVLTENAPLPLDTDVVGVFEDASSQINVLEEGKSVIKDWTNGGLFVGNEIEVKATLLANGFPIDTKDVTLYTVDPLTFSKTGDMVVERVPGKDAIAYTHTVLSLTSIAEEGNLINTESYPSQVFVDKYANEVYGAAFISQPAEHPEWNCQLVRVYTLENGEKVTYPGVKYMFNNGKVTLIADDGLLKQSIFAEVEYKLTHNYNYGQDETVTVVVEFKPNNAL